MLGWDGPGMHLSALSPPFHSPLDGAGLGLCKCFCSAPWLPNRSARGAQSRRRKTGLTTSCLQLTAFCGLPVCLWFQHRPSNTSSPHQRQSLLVTAAKSSLKFCTASPIPRHHCRPVSMCSPLQGLGPRLFLLQTHQYKPSIPFFRGLTFTPMGLLL